MAGAVFGADPVYKLREVANLVESIPDRELEFTGWRARRKDDLHLDEMLGGRFQGDRVSGVRSFAADRQQGDREYESENPMERRQDHFVLANSRKRAGSFS